MERRAVAIAALVAVLVAGVTAAVAVTVMDDQESWPGGHAAMMSSQRDASPAGRQGAQPGWQGFGGMMLGSPRGMQDAAEDDFLAEMVAHHEEAVATAQELRRSTRPEMRAFGDAIVASQSAQIRQMTTWLADWYPDRDEQVDYRPMMRDLSSLSGDRLDQVFLQDMIWHHMTAVMMSQHLLMRGAAEHDEVAALAGEIRDEQHAEILQMQQWLREWFRVGGQHGVGPWSGPWMSGPS